MEGGKEREERDYDFKRVIKQMDLLHSSKPTSFPRLLSLSNSLLMPIALLFQNSPDIMTSPHYSKPWCFHIRHTSSVPI